MQICLLTICLISIILSHSVKLHAAISGPVPPDGDGPAPQMCQTCCQAPAAGIPGIPGLAGTHGQPGSKGDTGDQGHKGEIRAIGQKGERGATGDRGDKGEAATGLPGKMGPKGTSGLVGATGETGVKGQKGEPGETPDDSNQRVAFTVTRTRGSTFTSSNHNTRIAFQETVTLLADTNFDHETGTFTCNVPGTYVFMFSILNNRAGGTALWVHLWKNNQALLACHGGDLSYNDQVSGSAVLVLQRGDTVYLTARGKINSGSTYHYTSFSGFLLYAE